MANGKWIMANGRKRRRADARVFDSHLSFSIFRFPSPPRARRGGAYILVLGVALLVTVIGAGALLATRVSGKEARTYTDWEEAGTLAQSAVEQAIACLNQQIAANPGTWRNAYTSYTSGAAAAFTQTMG